MGITLPFTLKLYERRTLTDDPIRSAAEIIEENGGGNSRKVEREAHGNREKADRGKKNTQSCSRPFLRHRHRWGTRGFIVHYRRRRHRRRRMGSIRPSGNERKTPVLLRGKRCGLCRYRLSLSLESSWEE